MSVQGEFFEVPKIETDVDLSHEHTTAKRGLKDLSITKLYYSISEVSRLTGLEQYVLRYWETEFEELRPQKNRAGNRIYSNKDISFILHIKELLREKRYTIEGAKQILRDERIAEREARQEETASTEPAKTELDPAQTKLSPPDKAEPLSVSLKEIESLKTNLERLRKILSKA